MVFAQVLIAPAGDDAGRPAAPAIEIEFAGKARSAHPGFDPGRVGGGCGQSAVGAMIPVPSGVRVWLAVGHTDMRRGMNSLALQVQEVLKRDPHGGDLYVFRGRRGYLIKILWHDGIGMSLYAKRLERWPVPVAVAGRRHRRDQCGAIGLHARRDRLAEPSAHLAPGGRRLTACRLT